MNIEQRTFATGAIEGNPKKVGVNRCGRCKDLLYNCWECMIDDLLDKREAEKCDHKYSYGQCKCGLRRD